MAHETLALHHSSDFHITLTPVERTCNMVDQAMMPPAEVRIQSLVHSIDLQLARVENLKAWASVEQIRALLAPIYTENLPTCSWETSETSYGACDGGIPCSDRGTIHDLASDMPYCCKHFVEVLRG
jgi:hypothetical protein